MIGIQEAPTSGVALSANPIIGIEKRCTKCGKIKGLSGFSVDKRSKDGHCYRCKECCKDSLRRWKENNIEKCREYKRLWKKNNPEKVKAADLKWARANPETIKKNKRIYFTKIRSMPKGKISRNLSRSILDSLRGNKNGRHWESLVGYTLDELKGHLEKQFKEGMAWDNYGLLGWHIDHKIPITAFNFKKPEDDDFKRCWALKNLQPLWAKDNIKKSNKINKHFQPRLIF